eukprot:TRINITY_DN47874_c0_g1_i1.p1 TRINITY_DN47874_c0_g1~~TRINITY_DN47874_c0_g1_i1.p1  ORF type:complete len:277 (+),score=44.40 TRINITY_DN47874_c0_g1_i1:86-832(+)
MRSQKCDTLFSKGAWSGRVRQALRAVPPPPAGWQMYREQLWKNPSGALRYKLNGLRLCICHGSVLDHLKGADALVNSANKNLAGPARPDYWMFSSYEGLSVEEAVHQQAGPELLEACRKLAFSGSDGIRCPIGSARATPGTASLLSDGFIIHAVAPGWHAFETSSAKLVETWRCSLDVATGLGVSTLVAPALGCGTNRTPPEDAAACALTAFDHWSAIDANALNVRLVLHTYEAWVAWTNVAFQRFGK